MNVMFLVNGRWFKTLCKTVLESDTFDVSISTEKHNIHAIISDKCYFKSIDDYCIGYDTIDTTKTDFFISRNFKNTKEFLSKLDDTLITFLNTTIRDKHFSGNIDECIEKCLQEIKKTPENNATDNNKETTKAKPLLNSAYGITAERERDKITKPFEINNEYNETEELLSVEQFERLTRTLYKSLFKAIGLEETKKIPFIISNNMVFFNYNGMQYKYYPSQCKIFKKRGRKYQRINWKYFADENNPDGQKQSTGRSPPFTPDIRSTKMIND